MVLAPSKRIDHRRVDYTGGDVANATYYNHGTHAEAIEIVFWGQWIRPGAQNP